MDRSSPHVVVVGGGYTGLASAYELSMQGIRVTLVERDSQLGGLAATFEIAPNVRVERFYHHWFTSDTAMLALLQELGLSSKLRYVQSLNGLYHANSLFRLSSPLDLLRFTPLPHIDRFRTGYMAMWARWVRDWRSLENVKAVDWIQRIAGRKSLETIWMPLLRGKFGEYAEDVSAVWFWNKLKLRGSSRDARGAEQLVYIDGGFSTVTNSLVKSLRENNVTIELNTEVREIKSAPQSSTVVLNNTTIEADAVIATVPLPEFLGLYHGFSQEEHAKYSKIPFLGNICLLLESRVSLSEMYWLNVTDPSFPYVGVIEHTRMDSIDGYGGKHLIYLSKYLPTSNPLYQYSKEELLEFSIPHLQRMFSRFDPSAICSSHLWRAPYSQPVVVRNYSKLLPPERLPNSSLWLATMAQIYPQDRGTNYAIRQGRTIARQVCAGL